MRPCGPRYSMYDPSLRSSPNCEQGLRIVDNWQPFARVVIVRIVDNGRPFTQVVIMRVVDNGRPFTQAVIVRIVNCVGNYSSARLRMAATRPHDCAGQLLVSLRIVDCVGNYSYRCASLIALATTRPHGCAWQLLVRTIAHGNYSSVDG